MEKIKKIKKNKGGRPTSLTPETVKKLEEAFAIDASVEEACFYADISRETFYTWIKQNKQFSDRMDAMRQRPVLLARQTAIQKIPDSYGNAMDYLSRKRKDEFGNARETPETKILILNISPEKKELGRKAIQEYLNAPPTQNS